VYSTTLTFPAGIFTGTVTITWTGYLNASHPRPADLAAIGHFFDVSGTYNSDGQPAEPTVPYTVTVQYTDAGKGPAIESTLAIYYWNGSQWFKEASSEVETSSNTVTAEPSHFSSWAVFGETRRVFVPLVMKNY
jgi:hypothetical protein